jgi:hypothetical protein
LPEDYPYINEILELKEALKILCQNSGEDEWIRFRFQPENKKKLIATRYEMTICGIPKQSFKELNYNE